MNTAAEMAAATQVHVLAAGNGTTWTDMVKNSFYDQRWWYILLGIPVLFYLGLKLMARMQFLGMLVWYVGIPFHVVFFLNLEFFIGVTQNQVDSWDHKAPKNPLTNRAWHIATDPALELDRGLIVLTATRPASELPSVA